MITIEQRAAKVLGDAEAALAELVGRASTERQYNLGATLMSMAQQLAAFSEKLASAATEPPRNAQPKPRLSAEPDRADDEDEASGYPRFAAHGDWLLKVGLSRDGTEYEHKCPRSVVRAVAAAASRVGASGKQFAVDKLMPLEDPTTGGQVPVYQVYLSLVWLRQLGLIEKHGRSRYSVKVAGDFSPAIETGWQALSTR